MIARHSFEQSGDGEGVEVIENRDCEDDEHGKGQYTEKRLHLSTYVFLNFAFFYRSLYLVNGNLLRRTGSNVHFKNGSFSCLGNDAITITTNKKMREKKEMSFIRILTATN